MNKERKRKFWIVWGDSVAIGIFLWSVIIAVVVMSDVSFVNGGRQDPEIRRLFEWLVFVGVPLWTVLGGLALIFDREFRKAFFD